MATSNSSGSRRPPSLAGSLAPSYATTDVGFELASLDGSSRPLAGDNDSGDDEQGQPLAPYGPSTVAFTPTVRFQIQTPGRPVISLPLPPRPDPIPVFAVDAAGQMEPTPTYVSVRRGRGSGSCTLVSGAAQQQPLALSTTTYRFGPGRHPQVELQQHRHQHLSDERGEEQRQEQAQAGGEEQRQEQAQAGGEEEVDGGGDGLPAASWDAFAITPRGLLTRAQTFRTRLGAFEWRYASRAERKAAGADSLLVLDRVFCVFRARGGGSRGRGRSGGDHEEERRTPVAQLVRNADLRSPGSSASSAGNGGRLLVDLSLWAAEETERAKLEVLVVTTALCMLKKEVDRRRAQQFAAMAAMAGGGGGP